jgi:hypothetical protein
MMACDHTSSRKLALTLLFTQAVLLSHCQYIFFLKKHSLELLYVRELHGAFKSKSIAVGTVAHIGINAVTPTGAGRPHCEVEFTVQLSESSPLQASSTPMRVYF